MRRRLVKSAVSGLQAPVGARIVAALATGETVVFPDDASSGAGSVYLADPVKLEQMLTG